MRVKDPCAARALWAAHRMVARQARDTDEKTAHGMDERTEQDMDMDMDKGTAQAAIEEHRARIDELDARLLELMNERSGESLAIRALKPAAGTQLFDAAREERILARLDELNAGPMSNANVREIYATLLKVMKEVEA